MVWNENYYEQLISKIDQFTRRFYINQMIRGGLYFTGLVTLVFLAFNLLENQFYFSKDVRKVLSFSYLALFAGSLWYWVLQPLMHYFRLGRLISHEEAAKIIGTHFTDVQDKLLNVLQLKSQSVNYTDRSLIEASIQQKSIALTPVPFVQAIDLNKNRKYLQYAIAPLFILASLLVWAPGLIQNPTKRLIQVNKDFEKEAPFHFKIDAQQLRVEENGNFTLNIQVEGSALPADAFIEVDHFQYRLKKERPDYFSYTFTNVQNDLPFRLFSGSIQSQEYVLKVMPKPVIRSFEVRLEYPAYTGRKNETLLNTGDLVVPAGTKIHWYLNADHTDHFYIRLAGEKEAVELQRKSESEFHYSRQARQDAPYVFYLRNDLIGSTDSVQYQLNVIPDQYPQIDVQSFEDSTNWRLHYFAGEASDDYGVRNISFNYVIKRKNGAAEPLKSIPVRAGSPDRLSTFSYVFDAAELNLQPGESVSYYFEVWDNDAVNGSKSARSAFMEYKEASEDELARLEESNNEDIKDNL
ncbi:MAG TPA: DUF4175 family protein, partial [Saprospiraceae bacterium]|nr:DUF4175 family protein [Saprospiraceae bacterium]